MCGGDTCATSRRCCFAEVRWHCPLTAARQIAAAEERVYARVTLAAAAVPGLCYLIAYLDRVNVGFAKLHMLADLSMSEAAYGFGAGIFFIGYFLFEVPSNLALHRVGARIWIARIMVTWGIISGAMAFIEPMARATGLSVETVFYGLRFLLGAAEAGFFPGVLLYLNYWYPSHRQSRAIALLLMAQPFSFVFGAPVSGAIMDGFAGSGGLHDWQWLFLIEAAPAVLLGIVVLACLDNGIDDARWLTAAEKQLLKYRLAQDAGTKADLFAARPVRESGHVAVHGDPVLHRDRRVRHQLLAADDHRRDRTEVGAGDRLVTAACYFSSCRTVGAHHAARGACQRKALACHGCRGHRRRVSRAERHVDRQHPGHRRAAVTGHHWRAGGHGAVLEFSGFAPDRRGVAAGLAAINSFGNLGGFVGPYLLGLLTQWLGSRTAGVAVLGAFMVSAGVLIALSCRHYGLRKAASQRRSISPAPRPAY